MKLGVSDCGDYNEPHHFSRNLGLSMSGRNGNNRSMCSRSLEVHSPPQSLSLHTTTTEIALLLVAYIVATCPQQIDAGAGIHCRRRHSCLFYCSQCLPRSFLIRAAFLHTFTSHVLCSSPPVPAPHPPNLELVHRTSTLKVRPENLRRSVGMGLMRRG